MLTNSRPAISAGRQQLKTDLVRLQAERCSREAQLSYKFRLESLSHPGTIEWLQWLSGKTGNLQHSIDRIKGGDEYLESQLLQLRTELGL